MGEPKGFASSPPSKTLATGEQRPSVVACRGLIVGDFGRLHIACARRQSNIRRVWGPGQFKGTGLEALSEDVGKPCRMPVLELPGMFSLRVLKNWLKAVWGGTLEPALGLPEPLKLNEHPKP